MLLSFALIAMTSVVLAINRYSVVRRTPSPDSNVCFWIGMFGITVYGLDVFKISDLEFKVNWSAPVHGGSFDFQPVNAYL